MSFIFIFTVSPKKTVIEIKYGQKICINSNFFEAGSLSYEILLISVCAVSNVLMKTTTEGYVYRESRGWNTNTYSQFTDTNTNAFDYA